MDDARQVSILDGGTFVGFVGSAVLVLATRFPVVLVQGELGRTQTDVAMVPVADGCL